MKPVMIITGGSQGIGASVARLGAARGYAVALTYQSNRALADQVVADIKAAGGTAIAVQAEMADEAAILSLFATVDRELGPVTVLVNNAGGPGPTCKIDGVTAEIIDQVMAVNVRAPFLTIREAIKRMATDLGGKGGIDRQRLLPRVGNRRGGRMGPLRGVQGRGRQPDDRRGA